MNLALLNNGTRFIILLLLQIIVFSQARIGPLGPYYIDIILFPLAYLLLPFRTPIELQFLIENECQFLQNPHLYIPPNPVHHHYN